MSNRHFPRLCRSCDAPMARQEDTCWRCGALYVERDGKPVTQGVFPEGAVGLPGTPEPLTAIPRSTDPAILIPA
jgi:hypothetical protein